MIIIVVSIKLGEFKSNKGVSNLPADTVEYVEDGLDTIEESDFDGIEFRGPKKRRLRGTAK